MPDAPAKYLQLKEKMIRDTILLVDPLPYDREALVGVLKRRLGKEGGSVKEDSNDETPSTSGSALHRDLHRLLKGRRPRMIGEMPAYLGAYERMCPNTEVYRQVMNLKRRYVKKAPPSYL